ncbi:MAG: MaoC family dehydratase [Alphaproteobacteria bacterium]
MNDQTKPPKRIQKIVGDQYFEDFKIGDVFGTESHTFAEDEIVAFAKLYDPQSFHVDPVAAKSNQYGGIIASGWQVGCITFRKLIDSGFLRGGGMGSPGLDEVRWHKPVRPGDTVYLTASCTSVRPSNTRTDRGYADFLVEVWNQKDERVMSYKVVEILRRRSAAQG